MKICGIDIGASSIKIGFFTENFKLVKTEKIDVDVLQSVDNIIDKISEVILSSSEIEHIGIGFPGVVFQGEVLTSPNLGRQWIGTKPADLIFEKVGLKASIDNDAKTACLAELKLGVAKDLEHFVYLTLGTGVGGTIVYNRQILRGETNGAGEVGHLILNYDENEDNDETYRIGIFEKYFAKNGLEYFLKKAVKKYPNSEKVLKNVCNYADINRLYEQKEESAVYIFNQLAVVLGSGIASLANILDISKFVLGGGITHVNIDLFNNAIKYAKTKTLPSISHRLEYRLANFGKDAGIYGAAVLTNQ